MEHLARSARYQDDAATSEADYLSLGVDDPALSKIAPEHSWSSPLELSDQQRLARTGAEAAGSYLVPSDG